jgi:cytochrome P450
VFFGLPADSADGRRLYSLYEALDIRKMSLVPSRRDLKALEEILAMLGRRARELEEYQGRGESPPACALAVLVRTAPNASEDETLLGNLVYMLQVGRADLTGLFMWILKQLGDRPEWAARLRESVRAQPTPTDPSLPARILRETLRLEQSEYIYRRALADIVFHDVLIPKGWRIRVLIREGHRDPATFEDPERFDPNRWARAELVGQRLATFGLGAHSCIGPQLTETAVTVALTVLARSFEWKVIDDGPREYGWAHWQPNARFRVSFRRRDESDSNRAPVASVGQTPQPIRSAHSSE